MKPILDILTSLLTPIIAGVVAYIAYQQHKTNRDKLMLDLYDRRLKVFEGLQVLLSVIFREGKCTDQERYEFLRATVEGSFLFDKDIANYLDTIHENTLKLGTIHAVLNIPNGDKQDQAVEKERNLFNWFMDQFEVSKKKFAKYLSFRQAVDSFERQTMNWKSGCKRITLVLSIGAFIFWIILGIYFLLIEKWHPDFRILSVFGVLSFIGIWLVYYLGLYIVKGFFCGQPVDEQKQ
jgi:hypothetical protein